MRSIRVVVVIVVRSRSGGRQSAQFIRRDGLLAAIRRELPRDLFTGRSKTVNARWSVKLREARLFGNFGYVDAQQWRPRDDLLGDSTAKLAMPHQLDNCPAIEFLCVLAHFDPSLCMKFFSQLLISPPPWR